MPLHPGLLAAYPVLHIAASNPGQAPGGTVAAMAAAASLAAGAIVVLARPGLVSWAHAALIATLATIVAFAFGPVHAAAENVLLDLVERGKDVLIRPEWTGAALSIAALVLLATGIRGITRLRPETVRRLTAACNAASLLLFALVAARFALPASQLSVEARATSGTSHRAAPAIRNAPDIYYIVLDGYARRDVLEHYYGFDNRDFIEGLRHRGFNVAEASTSNYFWTFLSLASALNFRYVDELAPAGSDASDPFPLYRAIRENAAARFLRERGYAIVHLQSTWGATRNNPHADVQVRCDGGAFSDEFVRAVAEASWLRVLRTRASADLARCHSSNFESLARMGARTGPKFVFAHFLLPHHPYLFDREGRVLRTATISDQFHFQARLWEDRSAYLEQLRHVNRRVLEAIDALRERSSIPPIIILQSDHGPYLRKKLPLAEELRIRFANLSAVAAPGAPASLIPDDVTPVNLLRLLFSHYFGADLPALPDRHFYSSFRQPLRLQELEDGAVTALTTPAPSM